MPHMELSNPHEGKRLFTWTAIGSNKLTVELDEEALRQRGLSTDAQILSFGEDLLRKQPETSELIRQVADARWSWDGEEMRRLDDPRHKRF